MESGTGNNSHNPKCTEYVLYFMFVCHHDITKLNIPCTVNEAFYMAMSRNILHLRTECAGSLRTKRSCVGSADSTDVRRMMADRQESTAKEGCAKTMIQRSGKRTSKTLTSH